MGLLVYNGGTAIDIPDRTLAHLQAVFIDKLRRLENFSFCWDDGPRRYVLWLGPAVPLEFVYSGNRTPALNRRWLEQLAMAAGASGGLVVMPEPPMPPPLAPAVTAEPGTAQLGTAEPGTAQPGTGRAGHGPARHRPTRRVARSRHPVGAGARLSDILPGTCAARTGL